MSFIFNKPFMLFLLPLVAVFAFLYILKKRKTDNDISLFTSNSNKDNIRNEFQGKLKFWMLLSAVTVIILALSQPAWNPHPKVLLREGRDVVFILDVSNSMLADDVYPNRLERAKMAITDCVDSFDSNRIGLVVFAGSASIKCPLTMDAGFFHYMLDKVGTNSVSQGGTRLADALLKTCDKLFSDSKKGYKDIILISDGGDHGGGLKKAADLLNKHHIKLIVIGIGDTKNGSKIPMPGKKVKYLKYNGRDVVSKLDSSKLREVVQECDDGAYLPVGTKNMHLDRIYRQLNTIKRKELLSDNSVTVYDEKFQLFLAAGFLLLVVMVLIPITRKPKSAIIAILLLICSASSLHAASSTRADAYFLKGDYQKALKEYQALIKSTPSPGLYFNLGTTYYKIGDYSKAVDSFDHAIKGKPSKEVLVEVLYNMGNSYYQLSKAGDDLEVQVAFLDSATALYRKVLRENPDSSDAASNLEISELKRAELLKSIEDRDKEMKEMQDALNKIREKIEQLIDAQSANLSATREYLKNKKHLTETEKQLLGAEKSIESNTGGTVKDARDFADKFFKGLPDNLSPVSETLKALTSAEGNEKKAVEKLATTPGDAVTPEAEALKDLKKALDSLPSQNQKKQGESEEESDSGDQDSDQEGNEEGESENMPSQKSAKIDLNNQEIPPPNESPEDILKRDEEIQRMRQSKESGKKRKPVKMDW